MRNKKPLFVFRQDCKNVEIGKNRSRGRPAQAVKALLRQDQRKRKSPDTVELFASTSSSSEIIVIQESKRQRKIDTGAVPVQIVEVESNVLPPKRGRGRPKKLIASIQEPEPLPVPIPTKSSILIQTSK